MKHQKPIYKISFSQEEVSELSKTAKDLRPRTLDDGKLQNSLKSIDKVTTFLSSYNFLTNIRDNTKNITLKGKIIQLLKRLESLYVEGKNFEHEFNLDISYGKNELNLEMNEFVFKNDNEIKYLCNLVYTFGKRIVVYDPDTHGGIIS